MGNNQTGRIAIFDSETGTYRAAHDFSSHWDLSATLSVALEEVADAEEMQLSESLFEAVDPDALAGLFKPTKRTSRTNGKVTFQVGDLRVTINGTGTIMLSPPEDA
jgi:hypothetical protein